MSEKVERVELASGFSISRVLTGLWQIADIERKSGELDPAATAAAMTPYVEAGLTTFDMADHYGSAEVIAGAYAREHGHESVQLFTKWVPKPGPVTKASVREAVQLALDRMGAQQLRLLQFHAWSYADPGWLDCVFFLQELKDEGLIGHLGLTNTDTAHVRMLLDSGVEIVSNQVCYSLLDQRAPQIPAAVDDVALECIVEIRPGNRLQRHATPLPHVLQRHDKSERTGNPQL